MQVVDTQLESLPWLVQTGPDVNPIPADYFVASHLPSGSLKVTNYSERAEGGALVTCKRPIPALAGVTLPYFGLDLAVFVSSFDLPYLGRLEIDMKAVTVAASGASIPNIANCSSQLNLSTGFWQIDGNPPGWRDTVFRPTLTPDQWIPLSFRGWTDGKSFSMLSMKWAGTLFKVPSSMQNVPLENSDWSDKILAVQLQTEVMIPGVCTVVYRGITVTWSDVAF